MDATAGAVEAGTLAAPASGAEAPAAGAAAPTAAGDGKNVALLPLCNCHLSHSKTMEKPKITHKMVRRMSFMKTSLVKMVGCWKGSAAKTIACHAVIPQARDRSRRHTRGGSVPACAA